MSQLFFFIKKEDYMFKLSKIEIKQKEPPRVIQKEYEKDGFHFHETIKKGREIEIKIIPPWNKTKRN